MTRHLIRFVLGLTAIAICTSCDLDTASSTRQVKISPTEVVLQIGESQAFTASGGYEYTWSLDSDGDLGEAYGTLSTRTGNSTLYTSLYDPDDKESDTAIQVLRVTSTIPGTDHSGGIGSNTNDAYTQVAEVYIVHISTNHPSLAE